MFSGLKSYFEEGTPESMARLIFFIVGITTCVTFLAALIYSLWAHGHGGDYDMPRNLTDALRDVFIASGAGKVAQKIWGENTPTSPSVSNP